jgi:isoleucyl-tRNA synthetase
LFQVRSQVLGALERARQEKTIRGSLDAEVHLHAEGELAALLRNHHDQLRALLIVSAVELGSDTKPTIVQSEMPGLGIAVRAAQGKKCERCWNYSPLVGTFAECPTVCERCAPVLEALTAEADK